MACSLGDHAALRLPDQASTPSFSRPGRSRWSIGYEAGRIGHDNLLFAAFGGQPFHDPRKNAPLVLPLPAVAERLVRAMFPWGIAPAQIIAVDEDDPAQDTPVIKPRLALRLWETELKTCHLRGGQPERMTCHRALFRQCILTRCADQWGLSVDNRHLFAICSSCSYHT